VLQFFPARACEETVFPDHTQNGADAALAFCGECSFQFEDPGFPGFGILPGVFVESIYLLRDEFGRGYDGDIVGFRDAMEIWRMPVNLGPVGDDPDEEDPENDWVEIFTPRTGAINEIVFEDEVAGVDDIKVAASAASLNPVPTNRRWIAAGFGHGADGASYTPFGAPSSTTDVIVDLRTQSEQVIITDQPMTVKSLTFNHDQLTLIAGASSLTLDSNTNNPAIDVLQGDVEFQSVFMLADSATVTVATGSTLVFNNVVNLAGRTLTITAGSDVAFNNQVILAGGSIVGSFGLGASGYLVSSVPEPTAIILLAMAFLAALGAARGRRPAG
jgi:hypothetical protein